LKDEEIDALALAVANELREQYRRESQPQWVGALTPDQKVEELPRRLDRGDARGEEQGG